MAKLTILCYDQIPTSLQSNGMAAIQKSLSIAKPILCHFWQCYHCLVIWLNWNNIYKHLTSYALFPSLSSKLRVPYFPLPPLFKTFKCSYMLIC